MPKSPNYEFERRERDRLKAQKVAAKTAAKREQQALARDAAAAAAGAADGKPETS